MVLITQAYAFVTNLQSEYKKSKRRKIYSVKDECFVYKNTGEKFAL